LTHGDLRQVQCETLKCETLHWLMVGILIGKAKKKFKVEAISGHIKLGNGYCAHHICLKSCVHYQN
jgi:hypothetical protein